MKNRINDLKENWNAYFNIGLIGYYIAIIAVGISLNKKIKRGEITINK